MKKYYLPALVTILLASVSFAASKKVKESDNKFLKNGVRVEVEYGEFFDLLRKNNAEVEIKISMKNAYGFDKKPETSNEKQIVQNIDNRFKNEYFKMIEIEDITCTYNLDKIEKKFFKPKNNKINLLKIKYEVRCEEPVKDHEIKLDFSDFQHIDFIHVELEGAKTEKFQIKGNQGVVQYK